MVTPAVVQVVPLDRLGVGRRLVGRDGGPVTSRRRDASLDVMSFDVAAHAYDRFMGRYSGPLSPLRPTSRGSAGTTRARRRVRPGGAHGNWSRAWGRPRCGRGSVRAFVAAAGASPRRRRPARLGGGAAVRRGYFDVALAQLVVHFMADPLAGLTEMARVTRGDGVVAACVWDHAGGQGP